ncbi:MAG: hypothetical protein R2703_09175 [Micropruina glycogenica]
MAQVAHSLRQGLQRMRAGLSVHCAFLEHCSPTPAQVVGYRSRASPKSCWCSPQLTHAIDPDERALVQAAKLRTVHPELRIQVSRPIGPEVSLLGPCSTSGYGRR